MIKSYYNCRDDITMLYDHTTIPCHEIMRSYYQMQAQRHQASFQATPKPPKGKHSAPSKKNSKNICKSRKKTCPREKWQEILRWKVAYALQVHFLQKGSSKTLLENSFSAMLPKIRIFGFSELRISSFGARSVGPPRFGVHAQVSSCPRIAFSTCQHSQELPVWKFHKQRYSMPKQGPGCPLPHGIHMKMWQSGIATFDVVFIELVCNGHVR